MDKVNLKTNNMKECDKIGGSRGAKLSSNNELNMLNLNNLNKNDNSNLHN